MSTQELLLRQLDSQIQNSERNNLLLNQDIQDLEECLRELLFILEQHQQNKMDQAEEKTPATAKPEEAPIEKEKPAAEITGDSD